MDNSQISDYFNQPDFELLILIRNLINKPSLLNLSIKRDTILPTANHFEMSPEAIEKIIFDKAPKDYSKEEKSIFNFCFHQLKLILSSN